VGAARPLRWLHLDGAAVSRWRVGRTVGRTIYQQEVHGEGDLIGVMDTPELAAAAVYAFNLMAEPLPSADYQTAWTELRGYLTEAVTDGRGVDPAHLVTYMDELHRQALAPVIAWLAATR
jgi:hypothetical protein